MLAAVARLSAARRSGSGRRFSNPGALQFFFLGLHALRSHDATRSRELLTQAIAEDQDFALAHSMLSSTYRILGFDQRAQEEAKRALDLSSQLGREDQLLIQGAYYEVTGDWSKAIEKYQALWNFFPDNIAYGVRLVYQLMKGGHLDEAGHVIVQIRALPPPADIDPGVDLIAAGAAARREETSPTRSPKGPRWPRMPRPESNNQLATARPCRATLHGIWATRTRPAPPCRRGRSTSGIGASARRRRDHEQGMCVPISRDQLDS
jgi:tetratricopeptide (TPR) repeat protein